jgi:hypothetical protein
MAEVNVIFRGNMSITSKTQGKKLQYEISMNWQIEPGRRMRWSDEYILFGPKDHPDMELSERNLQLVVKILIRRHNVAKTLVDSGASLNLMMRKTFIEMCLKLSDLTTVHDTFDEDINTSATIIPSVEILGPITRSRAQQLNHQVNSFLCSSAYNIESRLLLNNLIVLKNQGEDHGEQIEHQEGYEEPRRRA